MKGGLLSSSSQQQVEITPVAQITPAEVIGTEQPTGQQVLDGKVVGSIKHGTSNVSGWEVQGPRQVEGFDIIGDRFSVCQKLMQPGESFGSEPGAMMYMSNRIKMKARFAGLRFFSGEGLAKNRYTNEGSEVGYLGLSPNMPMAVVVPLDMTQMHSVNAKRGSYMGGAESVRVRPKLLPARSCLACCCGGLPPVIQSITGTGTALINAGGTVLKKELQRGEKILVDTDSVVAFQDGVGYDVRTVGTCITCCCSGEGCYNTELSGPGVVYLQSQSYEKLIKFLIKPRPRAGKKDKGGDAPEGAPPHSEEMAR